MVLNNTMAVVDFLEDQIKVMAKHSSVREVIVGLHNACVHGEIFEETGEDVSDEELAALFDHFEAISEILSSK